MRYTFAIIYLFFSKKIQHKSYFSFIRELFYASLLLAFGKYSTERSFSFFYVYFVHKLDLTILYIEYLVQFLVMCLKLVSKSDVWIQYRFAFFNTLYSAYYVPRWHMALGVWSPNENTICVLSFVKDQIDLEYINLVLMAHMQKWLAIINNTYIIRIL